jgi:predicted secreted protein
MSAYTATVSSIEYGGTTFEAIGSMSISSARPPIEITQVGSANAHFLAGILTTAIACDIYYNTANHATFTTALMAGSSAAFTFTAASGDTISGNAYVTGADVVATMGDIVRGSITLQATGVVTFAGTAAAAGGNEP